MIKKVKEKLIAFLAFGCWVKKLWKEIVVIAIGTVLATVLAVGASPADTSFENLPNVAKEQGLYRITYDEYSDVEIKDQDMPEVKLRKWGEETWIKISYPDFSPVNPKQDKGKLKWVNGNKEVHFYPLEKKMKETNQIKYIQLDKIDPITMATEYELYRHIPLEMPTVVSYAPNQDTLLLYGHHSLEKYFDFEKISIPITRFDPSGISGLPMYVNANVVIIDYHFNNFSQENVQENFYDATIQVLSQYGVEVTKSTRNDWLYYEKDGKKRKFLSSIYDGEQFVFYINFGAKVDRPDYIKSGAIRQAIKLFLDPVVVFGTKLGINVDIGYLWEANPDLDPNIIAKEIVYSFAQKINYNINHKNAFSESESQVIEKVNPFLSSLDWIKKAKKPDTGWSIVEKEGKNGFEIETVLKEKPTNNIITFDIETKGLNFYYQPELTQEKKDKGYFRPENVVGSYAVYHKTQDKFFKTEQEGKKYGTGKAFHIYRPQAHDANGNSIWGELNIDIDDAGKGNLTITIDQNWLDNAVYPVRITGSEFGYTGEGQSEGIIASNSPLESTRLGNTSQCPEDAEAVSITAWLSGGAFGSISDVRVFINEEDSGGSGTHGQIAVKENKDCATDKHQETFTLNNEELYENTDYILNAIADCNDLESQGGYIIYYDTNTANYYDEVQTYGSEENPWIKAADSGIKYSIYCTYTLSAGTYYFNSYTGGGWGTNPENMVDGSVLTYAESTLPNELQQNDGNSCTGTDLGTITKVELRSHGSGSSINGIITLIPYFEGADLGDEHEESVTTSPSWSSWFDITTDTNAPSPWTWADVKNLDVQVYREDQGGLVHRRTKVEIRVTYSAAEPEMEVYIIEEM